MKPAREESSLNFIQDAIRHGRPLYLKPYKEPKVWGVGGIGEYWYGAEEGEKSSLASLEGRTAPMIDVLNGTAEEILGEKAIKKFGRLFPLVKILTPKGRLSVQFHEKKNELWIVTGVDETLAGGEAKLIVGFSKEALDKYGEEVTKKYGEALDVYAKKLNTLIDILEESASGKKALEREKNAIAAAEVLGGKDTKSGEALSALENAKGTLETFYNYRTVKVGDVVPVPARTLHALGAGIEVVEPQIPGATQSTEDGATYPVRYYFPGYERPLSKKKLDTDRVGEIKAEFIENIPCEVLKKTPQLAIERLPGNFEDKGLEVRRITIKMRAEEEIPHITSFHNLVAVAGSCKVIVKGEEYAAPRAQAGGEMLIIPQSAGSFKVVCDQECQIIDTFTPV